MSTQVRGLGSDAVGSDPRSDPQIATRAQDRLSRQTEGHTEHRIKPPRLTDEQPHNQTLPYSSQGTLHPDPGQPRSLAPVHVRRRGPGLAGPALLTLYGAQRNILCTG